MAVKKEAVAVVDEINTEEALEACRQIEKQNHFINKARAILEKSLKVKAESDELEKQKITRRAEIDGLDAEFVKKRDDKIKEHDAELAELKKKKDKAVLDLTEAETAADERKAKLSKEVEWLEGQVRMLAAEKDRLHRENEATKRDAASEHIRTMAARAKERESLENEIKRLESILGRLRQTQVPLTEIAGS